MILYGLQAKIASSVFSAHTEVVVHRELYKTEDAAKAKIDSWKSKIESTNHSLYGKLSVISITVIDFEYLDS